MPYQLPCVLYGECPYNGCNCKLYPVYNVTVRVRWRRMGIQIFLLRFSPEFTVRLIFYRHNNPINVTLRQQYQSICSNSFSVSTPQPLAGPLKVHDPKLPGPVTVAPKFRDFYPNRFGQFLSEIRTTPPPNPIFIQLKFRIRPSKNWFFFIFWNNMFPALRTPSSREQFKTAEYVTWR